MTKKILVLPGDGVGPEVISSAVDVLIEASGDGVELEYSDIGQTAYVKTSEYLPAEVVDLSTDADAIIAGVVVDTPADRMYQNPIRALKKQLNLYSVVRKFFPLCERIGVSDVDMIIINGNPDSLLNIKEIENLEGVDTHKFLSKTSCKKLFQKTMSIASMKNRKKILCAHRSKMFPASEGMFVDIFYKELAGSNFMIGDMEVDIAASEMVMDPSSFDVIVSTDIYGTVLAGVAAGMVGGSYLTPVGSMGDSQGLFEPMHGPNVGMINKGYVNPTSAILSAAMALDFIGMSFESERIRKAVRHAYCTGIVTPDVGGTATTKEFTQSMINTMRKEETQ